MDYVISVCVREREREKEWESRKLSGSYFLWCGCLLFVVLYSFSVGFRSRIVSE